MCLDPSLFFVFYLGIGAGILIGAILARGRRYPSDSAPVTARERDWYYDLDWWPGITAEIELRLLKAMSIDELGKRGKDMIKLAKINEALEEMENAENDH